MRTHVISVIELPKAQHALIKKPVQRGDRLLFQTIDAELEALATDVQTEPGLMKGWVIASWGENKKEVSNG